MGEIIFSKIGNGIHIYEFVTVIMRVKDSGIILFFHLIFYYYL